MIVCLACQKEMKVTKIGVGVEVLDGEGRPYQLFAGDVVSCLPCNVSMVRTTASPIVEHFESDYDAIKEKFEVLAVVR